MTRVSAHSCPVNLPQALIGALILLALFAAPLVIDMAVEMAMASTNNDSHARSAFRTAPRWDHPAGCNQPPPSLRKLPRRCIRPSLPAASNRSPGHVPPAD